MAHFPHNLRIMADGNCYHLDIGEESRRLEDFIASGYRRIRLLIA